MAGKSAPWQTITDTPPKKGKAITPDKRAEIQQRRYRKVNS
jgi:hypothetical protein